MISPSFVHLMLFSILVYFVYEISTDPPTRTESRLFRAREHESRRNRLRYHAIAKKKIDRFPGIFFKDEFAEFVMPKLDDNIEQKFTLYDLKKDSQICPAEKEDDKPGPSKEGGLFRKKKKKDPFDEVNESKPEHRLFSPVNLEEAPKGVRLADWRLTNDFVVRPTPTTVEEYNEIAGSYYCSARSIPSVKKSKKVKYNDNSTCTIHKVGYEIDTSSKNVLTKFIDSVISQTSWKTVYEVCYDIENSAPVYTKHTLHFPGMHHRKLNRDIKSMDFNSEHVGKGIEMAYDLDAQIVTLRSQPNAKKWLKIFDKHRTNYFVRAHLVPEYDTLYENMQIATHEYLNFVPQWRSVNIGQWTKVEQDIRQVAHKLQKTLTIYTGVVYLTKPIYLGGILDNVKIPIPSYYWKYVHYEEKNAGIVLTVSNDIMDEGKQPMVRCKEKCEKFEWMYNDSLYSHRNRSIHGTVQCCNPATFFENNNIPYPGNNSKDLKKIKILTSQGQVVNIDSTPQALQQEEEDDETFTAVIPNQAVGAPALLPQTSKTYLIYRV